MAQPGIWAFLYFTHLYSISTTYLTFFCLPNSGAISTLPQKPLKLIPALGDVQSKMTIVQ